MLLNTKKGNHGLSANRPSNNWALEIKIADSSLVARNISVQTWMNKRTSQTIYGADIDPMRAEADDTPIPIFLGKEIEE